MSVKESVSRERLEQILPAAYDNYQLLVPALEQMIHYRIETLEQINSVAKKLDKRHRKGNIVKLVCSSVGLAGSTAALLGVALTPVTAGASLLLTAGGVVAVVGTGASFAAHVAEKVCEKVDLEKVQQAVDRDRRQCERVKELWDEFDSQCVDVINTIALADPSRESDMESFQTWVQVALQEVVSPVVFIAEAFYEQFNEVKGCTPSGEVLMLGLATTAHRIIGDPIILCHSVVSTMCKNLGAFGLTIAFLVIAGMGLGNLLLIITTSINMHKGSPSKVAEDLREKSKELQKELDKWLDTFGS